MSAFKFTVFLRFLSFFFFVTQKLGRTPFKKMFPKRSYLYHNRIQLVNGLEFS